MLVMCTILYSSLLTIFLLLQCSFKVDKLFVFKTLLHKILFKKNLDRPFMNLGILTLRHVPALDKHTLVLEAWPVAGLVDQYHLCTTDKELNSFRLLGRWFFEFRFLSRCFVV